MADLLVNVGLSCLLWVNGRVFGDCGQPCCGVVGLMLALLCIVLVVVHDDTGVLSSPVARSTEPVTEKVLYRIAVVYDMVLSSWLIVCFLENDTVLPDECL
jgi:hypothetical protein